MSEKFPIGFWNIRTVCADEPSVANEWADFGTTLTISGTFSKDQDTKKFLAILDKCYEKGIKMLIHDNRANYSQIDNSHYENDAKELISTFANHPAVVGFHLGDEPEASQTDMAIRAMQTYNRLCPNKLHYLNLLPWYSDQWGGVEARVAIQTDYKQYLVDFVKESGAKILSYDCYFQLEENKGELTDRALDTYFKNLKIFKEAADETGAELWYTTLAIGHMMYRCPTVDDIRWEISTAVAHGVKALFWWFYRMAFSAHANYRLAPINEFGERTETFTNCSVENRIFQSVFGELFMRLKLDKVWHVETTYGDNELFEGDEYIQKVTSNVSNPQILSRFTNPCDPHHVYYALVNNSQHYSAYVYIHFKKPTECFFADNGGIHSEGVKESTVRLCSPGQLWAFAVPRD